MKIKIICVYDENMEYYALVYRTNKKEMKINFNVFIIIVYRMVSGMKLVK